MVGEHGGEVLERTGDGWIAAFASVADPPVMAVEPFAAAPDDAETRAASDDARARLIERLARRTGIRVVDETTVRAEAPIYRLPGRLRLTAGRCRLALALVVQRDGRPSWSRSDDEDRRDALHLCDTLADRADADLRVQTNAFDAERRADLPDAALERERSAPALPHLCRRSGAALRRRPGCGPGSDRAGDRARAQDLGVSSPRGLVPAAAGRRVRCGSRRGAGGSPRPRALDPGAPAAAPARPRRARRPADRAAGLTGRRRSANASHGGLDRRRPRRTTRRREREARDVVKLSLADAEALVAGALERNATSPGNAAVTARALVAAEADGLAGHGLSRVASYAAQARTGKVDGTATPVVHHPAVAVAAVDAAHGFAYPALDAAGRALLEITPTTGVAAASIRRSHHAGAAGQPVERLARDGLVALLFANSPPAIAPWGGKRALFGTNPIAFACPRPGTEPLVVDLSLSKVARGQVVAAAQHGEAIPDGWAFDEEGRATTDPEAALAGTMAPLGDAKGTALALMVEILAAGLTGAHFASEASSFLDAEGPPPGTGQLLLAFDPATLGGDDALARIATLAAAIEAEPGARLPGRRRFERRARARTEGLEVRAELLATIEAL